MWFHVRGDLALSQGEPVGRRGCTTTQLKPTPRVLQLTRFFENQTTTSTSITHQSNCTHRDPSSATVTSASRCSTDWSLFNNSTQQFCGHDRSLFVLCWRLQSRCVKNGRVLIQTQRVGTSSPRAWLKSCQANLTRVFFSFSISFFLFYFLSLLFLPVFLSFALSAFFFLSFFSLYSFLSL